MPVDYLTPVQRQRYGRYPDSLSADEVARVNFVRSSQIRYKGDSRSRTVVAEGMGDNTRQRATGDRLALNTDFTTLVSSRL
ncbi:MAG: hypothetical protein JWQ49_3591 [Edaphobacter sp.]|nr:hypothetical protein [Edaphobacter sp.]